MDYLRLGRAKFCFEVELLFLVETFKGSVHLLPFLLLDMKWVSWVTFRTFLLQFGFPGLWVVVGYKPVHMNKFFVLLIHYIVI